MSVDIALSPSALFLDFDGTLVDIAERPEAVVVDPALPQVLSTLRARLGGALAVISGRAIATIDAFLSPVHFDAAGLHGAEHRIGGTMASSCPLPDPALRDVVAQLQADLAPYPAILIEDKGISVAVHWRLAPDLVDVARNTLLAAAGRLGPEYRVQFGKSVAEIVPAQANKGRVIERFLDEAPFAGRRPIFVGDDLTDEHGFALVNERGGLSIKVGRGPTEAQALVASPAAFVQCLAGWAAGRPIALQPAGHA